MNKLKIQNSKFNQDFSNPWYFLISHHYAEDYERCYKIKILGKIFPFCARCITLYPVALILLFLQLKVLKIPAHYDFLLLFIFPLPAFIEWGGRKINLWKSSNFYRSATGVFFGIGLSRGFYYYFLNYTHPLVWMQWIYFLLLFGIIVIFIKIIK